MSAPLPPAPAQPAAYQAGHFDFRGRRFAIDRRAYITDPELTHLVDAVVRRARELAATLGRAPMLLDFGVGCGSLAVSVALECPEARVAGLDIDPGALELARLNVAAHAAAVQLFLGNGLASLPPAFAPDLVFGDPPWGDASTIYAPDRPIEHYLAMPSVAVFPAGSPTGCHEEILAQALARGHACEFLLNAGCLPPAVLGPVLALADEARLLHPLPQLSLIHARLGSPSATGVRAPLSSTHP